MEFEYRLLKYTYTRYVQGSDDEHEEYALIYSPKNASFNNVRSTLFQQKYDEDYHKIDIDSVKDLTIKW